LLPISSSVILTISEWTPFQTHYFSENLIAPEIEPGTFEYVVFENMTQFKYPGTTVTNQNLIQEEIKRRLDSGNTCYHSVQHPLSTHLLSKNLKNRIYKTRVLPVVLYGCETWSMTLQEESLAICSVPAYLMGYSFY
jgi:hypothetical protein